MWVLSPHLAGGDVISGRLKQWELSSRSAIKICSSPTSHFTDEKSEVY